jgi:hypothetical protein
VRSAVAFGHRIEFDAGAPVLAAALRHQPGAVVGALVIE